MWAKNDGDTTIRDWNMAFKRVHAVKGDRKFYSLHAFQKCKSQSPWLLNVPKWNYSPGSYAVVHIYSYGRCVFCVWVCVNVFPLRCRSCYWTNTKLLGKGCSSKTSMNGNISMACYESQNPVTKESVVVGQANRGPVVFSSNVYSRQRRKCYRRLFFRLIFRQKICLMIASSSKAGNTLWRFSSRRLTWAGN